MRNRKDWCDDAGFSRTVYQVDYEYSIILNRVNTHLCRVLLYNSPRGRLERLHVVQIISARQRSRLRFRLSGSMETPNPSSRFKTVRESTKPRCVGASATGQGGRHKLVTRQRVTCFLPSPWPTACPRYEPTTDVQVRSVFLQCKLKMLTLFQCDIGNRRRLPCCLQHVWA